MADETVPASNYQGAAEAILATSGETPEDVSYAIEDLVSAYKENKWDNNEQALSILKEYADKIRSKIPSEENLLTPQETLEIAPVKPEAVDNNIYEWEEQNLKALENNQDPYIKAYEDDLRKSIETTATSAIQGTNSTSQYADKLGRLGLGAIPGIAKILGVEKEMERNLRADSNDTYASAITSGVGSLLALPIASVNLAANTYAFGKEEYDKSKRSGASTSRALTAGTIEGVNQAIDVALDKMLFGLKPKTAAPFVRAGLKKALGEGTQEVAQNKITEYADYIGLNKNKLDLSFKPDDAKAFVAGAVVGGVAHVAEDAVPGLMTTPDVVNKIRGKKESTSAQVEDGASVPPPIPTEAETALEFSEEIGISKEDLTLPPRNIAVIGEPVHAGENLTTIGDAASGTPVLDTATTEIASTDADEKVVLNDDQTITRIVGEEQKQAQQNATIVDEETAKKLAGLQATETDNGPIAIQHDDLGRPYILHPNVTPELELDPEGTNNKPVMIKESEDGHVLLGSSVKTETGSVAHTASITKGKITTSSTAGAQQIKESTIADKLRASPFINKNIKALLDLNNPDSISALHYPSTDTAGEQYKIDREFEKYGNNYVEFANAITSKDWQDLTTAESNAAGIAAMKLSAQADSIREKDPESALKLDDVAAQLLIANQKVGSEAGQDLWSRTIVKLTGDYLIAQTKATAGEKAVAQTAADNKIPVSEVTRILDEEKQLTTIEESLNQRDAYISTLEEEAVARHDAPDTVIAEIENEIRSLDNEESPQVVAAQEEIDAADNNIKEVEKQAVALEKQADDLDLKEADATDRIKEATKKLDSLNNQPIVEEQTTQDIEQQAAALEQQANDLDLQEAEATDRVRDANKKLEELNAQILEEDQQVQDIEQQATALEKQADDLDLQDAAPTERVQKATKKLSDAEARPIEIDTKQLDALKAKKNDVDNRESDTVKKAKEKLARAATLTDKARERLALTQAINEEKIRARKELFALEAEIKLLEEQHADARKAQKAAKDAEIKKAKEEVAAAKKEADTLKKQESKKLRAEAQRLRADAKQAKAIQDAERKAQKAAKDAEVKRIKDEIAAAKKEASELKKQESKKLRAEAQRLRAEAKQTKATQAAERKAQKAARDAEIKQAKEEVATAKKEAAALKKQESARLRAEAQRLRAEAKQARLEKDEARKAAKKQDDALKAERKQLLKERLAQAKDERNATKKLRKEQLEQERARLKEEKEKNNKNREKIQARRERNKKINGTIDKYKKAFANKLTPEITDKINELTNIIQTTTGTPKQLAIQELGKVLADIKGVKLLPGQNPWAILWQGNVLSGLTTHVANIYGNVINPVKEIFTSAHKPVQAANFARGWISAIFSKRSGKDVWAGLKGELSSRSVDDHTDTDLKDIATGIKVTHEYDPVRAIFNAFGSGKLGHLLSAPMVSLRALGAMDAVFHRAYQEGLLAKESSDYRTYLNTKAADYEIHSIQAKSEEERLKKLGVVVPKNYVNMRADELSFQARPQEQQDRITNKARKAVFQEKGGPGGLVASFANDALKLISKVGVGGKRLKAINAQWTVLSALGLTSKTARDNVSVDQIHTIVSQGMAQGKTLVINGKDIKGGSKEILSEIVDAVINKQVVNLRGDSAKPLKFMVGMFVTTGSQILDLSIEVLPVIGLIDKRTGSKWSTYTSDEKAAIYGSQLMGVAASSAILAAFHGYMDDEENAPFYIYGPMFDTTLRESYKAKGINPFTVRIGDKTFSYKDIPGLNLILAGFGSVADASMVAKKTPDNPVTIGSGFVAAAGGIAYASTQMSMLKNLGTFADILTISDNKPGQAYEILSNVASGFVPFAGAARDLERLMYGDLSRPKDLQNRLIQNIPYTKFFSDNKPALDMFGRPLRAHIIPGISRFIGDAKHSVEADWLLRNGYTVSLPKAGARLSKKDQADYKEMLNSDDPENFEPYLTDEDQYTYVKEYGPILEGVLYRYSQQYPNGFSKDVQDNLNKELNDAKASVKKKVLAQEY